MTLNSIINQSINIQTPAQQGAPLMMGVATIEARKTSNVNSPTSHPNWVLADGKSSAVLPGEK